MQSFKWGKPFITGISEVDEQHHQLVDIINLFSSHLAENELVYEDIETTYQKLVDYTQYHFSDEEKMMTESGIDQHSLNDHKAIHQHFLQEVIQMYDGISPSNPQSAQDLLEFLIHWLGYHILGTDQDMARQIKSIQSGVSASDAYEQYNEQQNSATEPLLAALNGLFKQVSKRNQELVLMNQSLEEKVASRTAALVEANKHFEALSLTDVLTNLPNRRHAMQQLTFLWDESKANNKPLSCMMIDADYFKQVNDTYGHDAGDLVLCELSKALCHSVRTDDIVSRLGGDEFLILCPNTDHEGALKVANKMHKNISELQINTGECQWIGSISVGLASLTDMMQSFEELLILADKGVYAAKEAGKNCVRAAQ